MNLSEAILKSRRAFAKKKQRAAEKLAALEKEAELARQREKVRLQELAEAERKRLALLAMVHRELETFFDEAAVSSIYVRYVERPTFVGGRFVVKIGLKKTISARAQFCTSNNTIVGVEINNKCTVPLNDAVRKMTRSMANNIVMIEEELRAKRLSLLHEKSESDGMKSGEKWARSQTVKRLLTIGKTLKKPEPGTQNPGVFVWNQLCKIGFSRATPNEIKSFFDISDELADLNTIEDIEGAVKILPLAFLEGIVEGVMAVIERVSANVPKEIKDHYGI